jgi:hypothetical protein
MIGEMVRYFPYPEFLQDAWISLFVIAVSLPLWLFHFAQVMFLMGLPKGRRTLYSRLRELLSGS